MRHAVILVALALPVFTVADRLPSQTAHRPTATVAPLSSPAARYSPEQLQRLRQSLVAQIAVKDDAEGLRAATDHEAAALGGAAAPATAQAVALPGGGVALRTDASQMSLAVAELADDGRVRVREGGASSPAVRGGAYVR